MALVYAPWPSASLTHSPASSFHLWPLPPAGWVAHGWAGGASALSAPVQTQQASGSLQALVLRSACVAKAVS